MKIELHMLQNFAPSCLNRDDTNSPKDCEFGGFRRARISSQCLKRSIRTHPTFVDALAGATGVRTKLLAKRLREGLADMGEENQVSFAVTAFVEAFASALDKSGEKTKVLLYLGNDEIARMEALLREHWATLVEAAGAPEKKGGGKDKGKTALQLAAKEVADGYQSGTRAADIAMFGRMVAEFPEMNLEAACQVAHAISTHKVSMELDFYTAVDDLQPEAETGAGMMGTVEFNSACFYRYALVDVDQLLETLGGDSALTHAAIEAFVWASVLAIPSGKQNSMAAQNLPSLVLAVARKEGAPWSLANAFEEPVRARYAEGDGVVAQSITRLDNYWGRLVRMYGEAGIVAHPVCLLEDVPLPHLASQKVEGMKALVDALRNVLS